MSLHKIAILLLLVVAIAVSGCCCCGNRARLYPPPAVGNPGSARRGPVFGRFGHHRRLVERRAYGTLVDPATGGVSGSAYNSEWYAFRSDGTYRYVIMSSGIALSGGVVREGYPDPSRSGQKPAYRDQGRRRRTPYV